jgi:DNA-binding response OmpR family regulator
MSHKNKTLRIDEILLAEGLVTEDQIRTALEYQREHGGRLGSHLVRLGFISEELVLDALAAQFDCDSVLLSEVDIPLDVIALIPAEVATARTIIPFAYEKNSNTLNIACEDPNDDALLEELLFVTHDKNIRLFIAAEMSLRSAIAKYYVATAGTGPIPAPTASLGDLEIPIDDNEDRGTILVVSDEIDSDRALQAALEQEGFVVEWIDSADDAILRIGEQTFRAVFIRDTVPGDYIDLIDRVRKVSPRTMVRYYESAGQMLLEETGYKVTGDVMVKNMQLFTTLLSSKGKTQKNHAAVVGRYTDRLCQCLGLPVKDRFHIVNAAYLHDISRYYYGDSMSAPDCRTRVKMTAKLLDSLSFPPLLVGVLNSMYLDLEDKFTKRLPIEALGGNILTIVDVFCEHASFDSRMSLDKFEAVRANLVALTGRLFLKEVTAAFVSLIEKEILVEPPDRDGTYNQVLMYCQDSDYLIAIAGRLKEEGFRPVSLNDVDKFVEMYSRSKPDMIVLLQEGHASKSKQLVTTLAKKGVEVDKVPTYLVTSAQSTPELANMIELGLEDVIPIENSLDLLVAKLHKLLSRMADRDTIFESNRDHDSHPNSVTSGNIEDINLVDLLQAMGPSCRTAKIRVAADVGKLTLYLNRGQVIRAESEAAAGAEAVYEAITWQTGHWVVQPLKDEELPEPNNDMSNEGLLMEGCRRLDEKTKTPTN